MPSNDLTVAALANEGRFEDALHQLTRESSGLGPSTDPASKLELAELLERTGRLRESRTLLSKILKQPRLTSAERARGLLLNGLLLKHLGHLPASAISFQQARGFAEQAGSVELVCWSELRLLGVSSESVPNESVSSLLADVRRNTERAAVPVISIAYHVFAAEYQAKRGHVAASRHHSDLAESLLGRYPNVWLRGLLDLQRSCLCYLEGDFSGSITAARLALDASERSGHILTRLIALADMAAGLAVVYKSLKLSYAHVYRTKEFDGQGRGEVFGSITLAITF